MNTVCVNHDAVMHRALSCDVATISVTILEQPRHTVHECCAVVCGKARSRLRRRDDVGHRDVRVGGIVVEDEPPNRRLHLTARKVRKRPERTPVFSRTECTA